MFNKKVDTDILNELKKLNDNMKQNNKLLQEIFVEVNNTKVNTDILPRINSNIMDLNNLTQVLLDNKIDRGIKKVSKAKEKVEDKPYNLKYFYRILDEKPNIPMYRMKFKEEDNDLLNKGKYKSKYNVTIKSHEIDLDKVDWDKSYLIVNYDGMDYYRLMLKENGRSFSKFSDNEESVDLYRFKTLVLYLDGKYIDIELNLFDFDDDYKVVDEDSGENWFYKKIDLDLDK